MLVDCKRVPRHFTEMCYCHGWCTSVDQILAPCSVAVELKELQPSAHGRSLMDEDPPAPDLDAGHISFAAIPRMGAPSVVVSERSPRPQTSPSTSTAAQSGSEQASNVSSEKPVGQKPSMEHVSRAASGGLASTSQSAVGSARGQDSGKLGGESGTGAAGEADKKTSPGMARGNVYGSSASLDSLGEPKKKRGGSDKEGIRCVEIL